MLSHLKVLDLTHEVGAFAGRILAELGAGVLRIEPAAAKAQQQAAWASLVWNVGKRTEALDVHTAEGREAFLTRVRESDILIRNRPDAPFDHAALAEVNPRLIDIVVAPFDAQGSLKDRPATDLTLMARSGLMAIVGDPDRAPLKLPGEQAYALAGIQAAIAALTALHARAATDRGQLVTVSALQSAVLANYREPLMWQWAGRIGKRTGNLLVRGKSGVRQVWPCRDGHVTWSFVDNPGMMRALSAVMAREGKGAALANVDWEGTLIADAPRETLVEWEREVEAFFAARTKAELAQLSVQHGFGLSQIDEVDDVLASEHLRERGLWRTVEHEGVTVRIPGPLFLSSEVSGVGSGEPGSADRDSRRETGDSA